MTNSQVCEAFANKATEGHSLNVFIEGNTIYSYGYHFPMASWKGNTLFITYRTYSNSTAKQMNHLWRALDYPNTAIKVADPSCGASRSDLVYWQNLVSSYSNKSLRARKFSMREFWTSQAHQSLQEAAKIEQELRDQAYESLTTYRKY